MDALEGVDEARHQYKAKFLDELKKRYSGKTIEGFELGRIDRQESLVIVFTDDSKMSITPWEKYDNGDERIPTHLIAADMHSEPPQDPEYY